jgi:hypothetical protein
MEGDNILWLIGFFAKTVNSGANPLPHYQMKNVAVRVVI